VVFGALAAKVAVLNVLLGVIPRPARVRHEHGLQLAGEDHASQEAAQPLLLEQQADNDRGHDSNHAQRNQLGLRRSRRDRHRLGVVRRALAAHDLRDA